MAEFNSPTDIGNRAAQHCGAELMDAVLGFTENSKVARQVAFVYGKCRRAELERNVWTFATRRAALRAVDTNTMKIAPALWVGSTTYFVGSIVSDGSGTNWISNTPNNLNNQPNASPTPSTAWEPYFGPTTVSLYDPTIPYFAGELVYTAAGDGTYNVYKSLISGNSVDPSLPNQWSATTTYFQNQVVQAFPTWAVGTTYSQGQTVTYTDGNTYTSLTAGNVGNAPPTSTANWVLMPTLVLTTQQVPASTVSSPPTSSPVIEWASGTVYSLGSFVMFNGTQYVSVVANNTNNYPNASGSTSWKAVTLGTLYMSLIDLNTNNNPANAPAAWSSSTTYSTGQQVYNPTDGLIYTSKANGNTGNNPSTDGGTHWTNTNVLCPWTSVFTQGGGNDQWMQIGGAAFPSGVALASLNINYPLGSGPVSQTTTRNIFRLPSGYLRDAPQDPKAGSISSLGAPTNSIYNDWVNENGYIITEDVGPIVLRFVADLQNVSQMKTMFCEGLAARIAMEITEPLSQNTAKLAAITAAYKMAMGEARLNNAIEAGADEEPLDDFIACRA